MRNDRINRLMRWSILVCIISGVIGLWYNIRTEPLNRDLQNGRQKLNKLHQTANELRIDILSLTSFDKLESKALNELKMVYPKTIQLWVVSANHRVGN